MCYGLAKMAFAKVVVSELFGCDPTGVSISVENQDDPIVIICTCKDYPQETLIFPSNAEIQLGLKSSGAVSVQELLAQMFCSNSGITSDMDKSFEAYSF